MVIAGRSRSKNGVAEPVIGPRVRADPLVRRCPGNPSFFKKMDARIKSAHDGILCGNPAVNGIPCGNCAVIVQASRLRLSRQLVKTSA
jgi:hypothetical protein